MPAPDGHLLPHLTNTMRGFPAIPIRQYGIPFQEDFYMRNRRATWAPAHELPYVQMFQCGKIA